VATADQQLEWEARYRPRAAIAAALGGLLAFAATIFNGSALSDLPEAQFAESLRRVAEPGPIGSMPSLRIDQFEYYDAHPAPLIIGALLLGLSSLAAAGALTYLAFATRARATRFMRPALYLPFVGGALTLLGALLTALASLDFVDRQLATDRTVDSVQNVAHTALTAGQLIVQFGGLLLASGFLVIALNAMRVGLLTRVFGGIGIFIGVLYVLPVPLLSQVLQPAWLFALSWLFLQRWPNIPPAWRTGRAEPWPTAAEAREEREAAGGGRRRRPAARVSDEAPAADADDPDAASSRPHPSSKKRKRKRRG
jgi:hypothetical protein